MKKLEFIGVGGATNIDFGGNGAFIKDGKNLGNITDLEINENGEILNFYSMPKRFIFKI